MGGGARRHASTNGAAVQHHNPVTLLGKFVRCRKPRNARTDYDNVCLEIVSKRDGLWRYRRICPNRLGMLVSDIHMPSPGYEKLIDKRIVPISQRVKSALERLSRRHTKYWLLAPLSSLLEQRVRVMYGRRRA